MQGSEIFPQFEEILATFIVLQASLSIILGNVFQCCLVIWCLPCVLPKRLHQLNPDSCCHLDSKVSLANEHQNCWVDRVSYHIHLHSTDSDNIVLLSEKEHCTHGTLCSFPSVDIWVIALLQPVWILVNQLLIPSKDVYPVYDHILYEKLCLSHFSRELLFKPQEQIQHRCKEYPSTDCGLVQSP